MRRQFASGQELVFGAIASLVTFFFILLPPVEVAGLSLWFYLIPALFAAYRLSAFNNHRLIDDCRGHWLIFCTYQVTGSLMLQNR